MLAIGKESVPVRIAELKAAAGAILFACKKILEDKESSVRFTIYILAQSFGRLSGRFTRLRQRNNTYAVAVLTPKGF